MKIKRLLSVAAAAVIFTFASPASAQEFSDVTADDWFSDAVNYVTEREYFSGMGDGTFAPSSEMTRGMFVTVLGRMAGIDRSQYTKSKFKDVQSGMWYSTYVNWAASVGIVSGFEDGKFLPEANIDREQVAVMLNSYITNQNITLTPNPNARESYSDESSVSDWAKSGVALMRASGIFAGDTSGKFYPQNSATRAEIANVIMRLSMAINGETLIVPTPEPYSRSSEILDSMTLEEKIYQMCYVTPEQLTGAVPVTVAGEVTKKAIQSQPVGGIIYAADNLVSDYQIRSMLENTSAYSKIKPFFALAEEGGNNAPAAQKLGTASFNTMYSYRNDGAARAYEIGTSLARGMSSFGFNQNFAPVADVWTNMNNTMIAERAFSSDSNTAAAMVAEAVKGMQDNGVIATLKHFPGYGDTDGDANYGTAYTNKTLEQLRNCEFIPFRKGIEAGADFVMCGNINVPALENCPAAMSHKIVTELLKDELGFNGIVITDALNMDAVRRYYTSADAAVKCIEAGCDMLLCPDTFSEAVNAVISAVQNSTISESRINESVKKILDVKLKYGIIS